MNNGGGVVSSVDGEGRFSAAKGDMRVIDDNRSGGGVSKHANGEERSVAMEGGARWYVRVSAAAAEVCIGFCGVTSVKVPWKPAVSRSEEEDERE
ncbi:hypothetical protein L6452_37211 [Arctium lappa]|uniref:Uncharacterized protein n=1 Tax=Arctium lappa TaxID=4217 RepID=A0ACB8Y331_ARCLA|nr:hypothetical protein L6452_37211 [Arctium lappa]